MTARPFTHAMWLVCAGNERLFIEKSEQLAEVFGQLDEKPLWGSLVQSTQNSRLFHSFGPWRSERDIAAMRATPEVQAQFSALIALCDEATPSTFVEVKHIVPRGAQSSG